MRETGDLREDVIFRLAAAIESRPGRASPAARASASNRGFAAASAGPALELFAPPVAALCRQGAGTVYVVARGSGRFAVGDGPARSFGPGETLSAPAGTPHSFAALSDDFAAWIVPAQSST